MDKMAGNKDEKRKGEGKEKGGPSSHENEGAISNWIPKPFQQAAEALAKDAVKKFLKSNQVIGLGSGPMAAAIVREMNNFKEKETLSCVPSSFQIKLEAECSGLRIVGEDMIPEIDVVFDGADQVDSVGYSMIKGGGGALFREKTLHSAAKRIVIAAESNKFVNPFTWPVPIEVHPFAVHIVRKHLENDHNGTPKMRMLKEDYPYVTQNGNFILDTYFDFGELQKTGQSDATMMMIIIARLEKELKNIAGVIQVGLFSHTADVYYKAKDDGTFDLIEVPNSTSKMRTAAATD